MRRSSAFLAVLVAAGLLATGTVWAQGYSVYEQSACMTGRGGTGVASPCSDASAVYLNPAGLSFDQMQIGLGGGIVAPTSDFTDAATGAVSKMNNKVYPLPNLFFSRPVSKRVAFGVGVFAPFAIATDWPETSQGRFLSYKSIIKGAFVQPTVAFKVNDNLSIGAGVNIAYVSVELRQRLDLAAQTLSGPLTFAQLNLICPAALCGTVPPGTDFGDLQVKGSSLSAGFHLGVLGKLNDRVSVGARWMSGRDVDISNGELTTTQIPVRGVQVPVPGVGFVPVDALLAAQFASAGPLSNQDASTTIPLPDQVVAGIAVQASENVKLLADYQFTRWSMFDVLPINGDILKAEAVQDFNNTHGIRIGAEMNVSPSLVLRAGFSGHSGAAPAQTVTPTLPEDQRQEYMVGLGAKLSPRMHFDIGYMYMHQPERAGRTVPGGVEANNGVFTFGANALAVMLALTF